jgi:hypothetical protein
MYPFETPESAPCRGTSAPLVVAFHVETEAIVSGAEAPWREHLRRMWAQHLAPRANGVKAGDVQTEWGARVTLLRGLGVGLRETITFIFERGPSFEEVECWIAERNGGAVPSERLARLDAALRGIIPAYDETGKQVLSGDDLAFFREFGYVIVPDAVSPAQCAAAERAIWTFRT